MTILDDIIHYKRAEELPRCKERIPLVEVQRRAAAASPPADFVALLRGVGPVALIAEIKRASPSKGLLCPQLDPLALASVYIANGAAAISGLTDARYFQGSLEHLEQVHALRQEAGAAVGLLRKDFIVDAYQVYEARAAGADAVLLIAAVLTGSELAELLALARSLGMEALIEVHDEAELERALRCRPRLIGVNNRDLRTFKVALETCLSLAPHAPPEVCLVAESGIHSRADVERLAQAGVDAILVGEALVTSEDPAAQTALLSSVKGGFRR